MSCTCGMACSAHFLWFALFNLGTNACQLTRCQKHPMSGGHFFDIVRNLVHVRDYFHFLIILKSMCLYPAARFRPHFFYFVSATDFKTTSGKPATFKCRTAHKLLYAFRKYMKYGKLSIICTFVCIACFAQNYCLTRLPRIEHVPRVGDE